jgi:putative ABC transport system ATP-binding protein
VLGSNGSGKSSLIKIINKTNQNFKGDIIFELKGQNIKISSEEYLKHIATITQDIDSNLFLELSVLENCILYASRYKSSSLFLKEASDQDKYSDYLKKYNVKLSSKLGTQAAKLSGGERQSLILALTFLHTPSLLLLDEHTSALDPLASAMLMQLTSDKISDEQVTCIMTTHSLDHALRYGNKLIALKDGKIIFHADEKKKSKLTKEDLIKYCY